MPKRIGMNGIDATWKLWLYRNTGTLPYRFSEIQLIEVGAFRRLIRVSIWRRQSGGVHMEDGPTFGRINTLPTHLKTTNTQTNCSTLKRYLLYSILAVQKATLWWALSTLLVRQPYRKDRQLTICRFAWTTRTSATPSVLRYVKPSPSIEDWGKRFSVRTRSEVEGIPSLRSSGRL